MDILVPSEKKSDSDVNGTVVVNMFTLEVAVEDIDIAGEKAGKTTANETLLTHAGWQRHHCFGAAVQKGEFRIVSGFINGLREGYKIVTAPAYDGPYSAFGQLQTDRPSEALEAFKKFTKDKDNREKAEIQEEARKLAVELARVKGFSKASFSLDPLVQAYILGYLCDFGGGMEDCSATKEMLEHSLNIYEEHLGEDDLVVAHTLNDLSVAYGRLGDPWKQKDLLERALKIFEQHYGEVHPDVAFALINLGAAYAQLGDPSMTKNVLERALEIQEQHFGEEHLGLANTLNNLGEAYGDLGDHDNQKNLLERALKIKEQHYGEVHFETALTLNNLGNAYGYLGDHNKKKNLLERALEINEQHFGPGQTLRRAGRPQQEERPPRARSQDNGTTSRGGSL